METSIGKREGPGVTGIVSEVIKSAKLPLYDQAAAYTGFGLSVNAREGEPHTFWLPEREGIEARMRTVTIEKGYLGITITKPVGEKDFTAFWKEYDKLQAEQNPPKSSL